MSVRAIVTGHSRGLGAGIAAALLEHGAHVMGISRGGNASLAKNDALHEVLLDLADLESVSAWLEGPEFHGFLKGAGTAVLVNNAGVLQPIGPLETQDVQQAGRAAAVNLGAALMLSAAFAKATRGTTDRRILHVSSGAGRKAYAGWSVYCATKAALDHHARAVAADESSGLRISSVAPGVIDTDMQAEIRDTSETRFPDRARFVALKREGSLRDPARSGRLLVELLLDRRFGKEPVTELRYDG